MNLLEIPLDNNQAHAIDMGTMNAPHTQANVQKHAHGLNAGTIYEPYAQVNS